MLYKQCIAPVSKSTSGANTLAGRSKNRSHHGIGKDNLNLAAEVCIM